MRFALKAREVALDPVQKRYATLVAAFHLNHWLGVVGSRKHAWEEAQAMLGEEDLVEALLLYDCQTDAPLHRATG